MIMTDLRKELKKLYSPKEKPEIVDVPSLNYLTYTGRGEPGGPNYTDSINSLYSTVYTLKFASKKKGSDFTVMPLEGIWWWDDGEAFLFEKAPPKEKWNWISMIVVPDWVTAEMLEELRPELIKKKGKGVAKVKLEKIDEGLSAQILYIGSYSDEERSIRTLHAFVAEKGYRLRGRHHEIYMGDPRRSAPEKLKTIIRHPVEK